MGEVYRARCRPDGKIVAIKIEGEKASQDPRAHFRERFLREARILRELRHENLPQFYAVGEVPDGRVFIAMELLIGRTLSEFVGQDLETFIPLFLQCARALKVTSEAGVVHRDVSPDNFFVVEVGGRSVVKLIDFGISRDAAAIADGLTRAGTFLGKLKYCSPEQTGLLRGLGSVDWRTDLYSFALTMHAILLSRLPFRGSSAQEQFQARATELPPSTFDAFPRSECAGCSERCCAAHRPSAPRPSTKWWPSCCASRPRSPRSRRTCSTRALGCETRPRRRRLRRRPHRRSRFRPPLRAPRAFHGRESLYELRRGRLSSRRRV